MFIVILNHRREGRQCWNGIGATLGCVYKIFTSLFDYNQSCIEKSSLTLKTLLVQHYCTVLKKINYLQDGTNVNLYTLFNFFTQF